MNSQGFEPVLSTDETDALLSAMRGSTGSADRTREVELGSTDHRLRQSLGQSDVVARELATEVRKMLRRLLTASASVREGSADVVPFNVVSSAIGPGSAIGILKTVDGSQAFIVAGANLVSHVITRRLGGAVPVGNEPAGTSRPPLSAVDRRIVRPFLSNVLEQASARLGRVLTLEQVISRASDLPPLPQFEPLVRIPLTIQLPSGGVDELSLLLTSGALPVLPDVPKSAAGSPPSSEERSRLAARLAQAEVELMAHLGRTQSSVRRVLSLKVGDVIRLEGAPNRPVDMVVEGSVKMRGTPVVKHGNIAVEVTEVLKGGYP